MRTPLENWLSASDLGIQIEAKKFSGQEWD